MELIKQQRLNRLCEGTCFRKISSRRRQGEKRCTHMCAHTQTHTRLNMHTCTDPNWADLGSVQEGRSSVSSLSPPVCSLSLLSAPPLIALFPLRYENPKGETISQGLWSSGLLWRCCSHKSFWLCQPSRERHTATRLPLLPKHTQKCSTHVFMSWDAQTGCLPPAFAPADTWHAKKCKDARGQEQGKTHINTHLLR